VADFAEVIRRGVDGLANNTPEMRAKLYAKARGAIERGLENLKPRPPAEMLQRQRDKLEAAIAQVESEESRRIVAFGSITFPSLSGDDDDDDDDQNDGDDIEIADSNSGPGFALTPNGKLRLAPSSFASSSDLAEIGRARAALTEAVDDLLLASTGSNTHQHIHELAKKYRAALGSTPNDMSPDLMFFYGVRLQNTAHRMARAVTAGDLPESSVAISEALDSVVAIHGPTIMSTQIGRELVAKAQSYNSFSNDLERFKSLSQDLIHAADSSLLLERQTAEELNALTDELLDAPDTGLTAQVIRSTNNSFLTWCARAIYLGGGFVATTVVAEGITQSQVGAETSQFTKLVIDKIWLFFNSNPSLLFDLAALAVADLQWLPAFVRWMKIKHVNRAAEEALHEIDPKR
jgi:hypothetical protein